MTTGWNVNEYIQSGPISTKETSGILQLGSDFQSFDHFFLSITLS